MRARPGSPLYEKLIRQGKITPKGQPTAKPGKHRNVRTETTSGELFDSRLEERVVRGLRLAHGDHAVIRQISFPLITIKRMEKGQKGLRIRPDAMIIHEIFDDGTFRGELIDAKGKSTQPWKNKAKILKDRHGLSIRLITK